jgi:general secretion pathway protein F
MALFHYQAVDAKGAPQAGQIESSTRSSALDVLHRRGLIPVAVNEGAARSITASLLERLRSISISNSLGRLSGKELVALTQSLAALLKAGLMIDRALAITANLNKRPPVRLLLVDLGKSVRAGRSFADALIASAVRLPAYYVGMVQAGEVGGNLPQTLARLGELLRKQHDIRERVRSALIYPAILAGVVGLTVVLLLTFVLPRFGALFAESETPLPWSTRVVLAVGGFVSSYWWLLALIGIGLAAGIIMSVRSPRGRERIDGWLLRSRWTLGLPAAIDTARLLRTLSTLLTNGVPLAMAMRIGRSTLSNTRLRSALDEAAKQIKAGESTSNALAAVGVFPAHAVQLARVGEETGRLEELLLEAATILEDESQTSLERLLTLLVPMLTISMGLLIAALIGSVLVGLLSINDLAF